MNLTATLFWYSNAFISSLSMWLFLLLTVNQNCQVQDHITIYQRKALALNFVIGKINIHQQRKLFGLMIFVLQAWMSSIIFVLNYHCTSVISWTWSRRRFLLELLTLVLYICYDVRDLHGHHYHPLLADRETPLRHAYILEPFLNDTDKRASPNLLNELSTNYISIETFCQESNIIATTTTTQPWWLQP